MNVKIRVTQTTSSDAEISINQLFEAVINVIEKDANLDGQWINQEGNLEYEVRGGAHSFYKEAGKPSEKQLEASKILKAVKNYRNKYLNKN